MDRNEIRALNDEIQILKGKYEKSINSTNYAFWPEMARLKKIKKIVDFLSTVTLCSVFIVVLWILLYHITNEYKLGFSLGLSITLAIVALVFDIRINKKITKMNKEWQKSLENPDAIQKELREKCNLVTKEMLDSFDNKDKVICEIGTSYEDVFEYYKNSLDK